MKAYEIYQKILDKVISLWKIYNKWKIDQILGEDAE